MSCRQLHAKDYAFLTSVAAFYCNEVTNATKVGTSPFCSRKLILHRL